MAVILKHRKRGDGSYLLVVHVDETRPAVVDDQPNPAATRVFAWPAAPDGVKADEYVAMQLREAKALLEEEQAQAKLGRKLPGEGGEL